MRLIFLLFFFTSLFACDTSSNSKAYQQYTQAKEAYLKSMFKKDNKIKIKYLKEIISCGKFLGIKVDKYQLKLNQLTKQKSTTNYKATPLKIKTYYIKLLSTNPINIRLSSNMKVKYFILKNRYVFDIYNAKISRMIIKKVDIRRNILLKIAQNNHKKVRVVVYSKYKIRFKITKNNLIIYYDKTKYTKQTKTTSPKIYKKHRIIVIDPGHGGKDPGAIGQYRIKEKNIVLPLAKYLKYELTKRGYTVYLTRDRDKFITLKNRTKFANQKKADLFISIHCNIAPRHPEVYGIETYFLSPARSQRAKNVAKLENSAIGNLRTTTQNIVLNFLNKNRIVDSTKLAIDIQKSLIYNLKKHYRHIKDGGVRPAPFWVLVGTNMPAILIEAGFISNKGEALNLRNRSYQKRYAKYIADGIDNYFRKNP